MGEFWARGGPPKDDSPDDLRVFGAPPELVDSLEAKDPESDFFEVWPENWEALQLFLCVSTQWVFTGMGSMIGLNYQSVEFVLKLYRNKERKRLFEELQFIERGALKVFQEPKKTGAGNGA